MHPARHSAAVEGSLTRRLLLRRAALTAAAVAVAGSGVARLAGSAGPVAVASLGAKRRRTYAALVDAVGRAGTSQVDSRRAGPATRQFAREYARALEPTRAAIDATLDAIECQGGASGFASLDARARLDLLRALARDPRRADLAGRAVALVAGPFHPPADDFHPTPVHL